MPGSIMCKVGMHRDGDWVSDSAEQCIQTRTCWDCGKQLSRKNYNTPPAPFFSINSM